MKNRLFSLGILVLVLAFGMAVVGCGYEGGGGYGEETIYGPPPTGWLTITGLDDFNSKSLRLRLEDLSYNPNTLYTFNPSPERLSYGVYKTVFDGQVTFELFVEISIIGGIAYEKYSGSEERNFKITIGYDSTEAEGFSTVKFTNGVGTGKFELKK